MRLLFPNFLPLPVEMVGLNPHRSLNRRRRLVPLITHLEKIDSEFTLHVVQLNMVLPVRGFMTLEVLFTYPKNDIYLPLSPLSLTRPLVLSLNWK